MNPQTKNFAKINSTEISVSKRLQSQRLECMESMKLNNRIVKFLQFYYHFISTENFVFLFSEMHCMLFMMKENTKSSLLKQRST